VGRGGGGGGEGLRLGDDIPPVRNPDYLLHMYLSIYIVAYVVQIKLSVAFPILDALLIVV